MDALHLAQVVPQRGAGLGERLANGFTDLGPKIVVGMETPHVASLLPDALEHLLSGDDILGPADDGGFWTIGLCSATAAHAQAVFREVEMSTDTTGFHQLAPMERRREIEVVWMLVRWVSTVEASGCWRH